MSRALRLTVPSLAICWISVVVLGCQSEDKSKPSWEHEQVSTLELQPEWRQYAEDNYRGLVQAKLNRVFGLSFTSLPRVVVTDNQTRGAVEMLASGSVDVPDATGKKYRRPYIVVWRQRGKDWIVQEVTISPGPEAPVEKSDEPAPMPMIRPTSKPAAAPAAPSAP